MFKIVQQTNCVLYTMKNKSWKKYTKILLMILMLYSELPLKKIINKFRGRDTRSKKYMFIDAECELKKI